MMWRSRKIRGDVKCIKVKDREVFSAHFINFITYYTRGLHRFGSAIIPLHFQFRQFECRLHGNKKLLLKPRWERSTGPLIFKVTDEFRFDERNYSIQQLDSKRAEEIINNGAINLMALIIFERNKNNAHLFFTVLWFLSV